MTKPYFDLIKCSCHQRLLYFGVLEWESSSFNFYQTYYSKSVEMMYSVLYCIWVSFSLIFTFFLVKVSDFHLFGL